MTKDNDSLLSRLIEHIRVDTPESRERVEKRLEKQFKEEYRCDKESWIQFGLALPCVTKRLFKV